MAKIHTEHQAVVVPGSVKSSAVGGVEFVVRCCGQHEKSVHIQHPGKHSQEELLRIRDEHLAEIAREHANHEVAVEFLTAHANLATETHHGGLARQSHGEKPKQAATVQKFGDCGCGGAS